jgi:RNA polymerase sigma-70 factor, ECF subfamily
MNTALLPYRSLRKRKRLKQITEETDEAVLVRYCKTRQREDFAQLVYRYERELFNYLRRYLGDAEMADDAFQATFLQVHLKCESFSEDRRFRPWLYAIATHQAIDAQRKNKRHKSVSLDRSQGSDEQQEAGTLANLLISQEMNPVTEVSDAEHRQWLKEALALLPEPWRQVIDLAYFQGMKYRDVSEVLGIPVGTIKSRMHAAILKLNEMWKAKYQELS